MKIFSISPEQKDNRNKFHNRTKHCKNEEENYESFREVLDKVIRSRK